MISGGRRAGLRACILVMCAGASSGCREEAAGTSLLVHLRAEAEAYRPEYVLLTWRAPGGKFRADLRVPESGALPATTGFALGSVLIELDGAQAGERQLVARGMRGDDRISGATLRVPWRPSQRQEVELTFVRWHDGDGDGIPDSPGEWPDAGPSPDAASADAAAPDAGAPGPDAATEGGLAEAGLPREPDTAVAPPDASPDTRPDPDGSPADASEGGPPPQVAPGEGRVLYLRLDDMPAGLVARDDSGHRNMATLVDFGLGRRPPGRYGTALAFGGGDQGGWIRVDSSASINGVRTAFTIAAWVHAPDGSAPSGTLLSRRASGPGGFIYRLQVIDGGLRARINSANGYNADVVSPTPLARGRWVHVAATFDLLRVRTYVDGMPAGDGPYGHSIPDEVSPLLVGGAESSPGVVTDRFVGRLDEVLLYDRALGPGDIEGLARSTPRP